MPQHARRHTASLVRRAASQTFRRAAQMTDPYLNLFRGLVPPLLGTIDFTPLLGFFILQFISGTLDAGTADDESAEYW
jgi:uncharacterized protein YggT (Ycf19 family)